MLRKKGKAMTTTQQKGKAMQHNLPEIVIFQRKIGCLGRDSNPQPSALQATLLPTKLPRQLSWLGSNPVYNHKASQPDEQANSNLCTCMFISLVVLDQSRETSVMAKSTSNAAICSLKMSRCLTRNSWASTCCYSKIKATSNIEVHNEDIHIYIDSYQWCSFKFSCYSGDYTYSVCVKLYMGRYGEGGRRGRRMECVVRMCDFRAHTCLFAMAVLAEQSDLTHSDRASRAIPSNMDFYTYTYSLICTPDNI